MNLTVPAKDLADEVTWLAKLKTGSGLDATHVVQVGVMSGCLRLRRANFEQYREATIPAAGAAGEDAIITVDAAKLASQLTGVKGSAVITVDGEALSIRLTGKEVRLRGANVEFMEWPEFEPGGQPSSVSARQLSRVLTSVGRDSSQPMLTGVKFDDGSMITTDRFRLTRVNYAESGCEALVPGAVLQAFAVGDNAVIVEPGATGGKSMVRAASGRRSVIAPTLDENFPKWRQLIPDEAALNLLLRRDDLLAAAQCDEVTLSMKDADTMLVSSTDASGDVEVIQEVTVTTVEAPTTLPLPLRLRTKYLTDCLKAIGSGAIRLKVNDPVKPVLFEDIGSTDFHLLMPVRIPGERAA